MNNEEKILVMLETLVSDVSNVKSDVTGMKKDIADLKQGQAGTNQRLDKLEEGQAGTNQRLDKLEKGQARLEIDVKNIKLTTNYIFDDIRRLDNRTELLENKA